MLHTIMHFFLYHYTLGIVPDVCQKTLPKSTSNRSNALIPTSKADKNHHKLGLKSIQAIIEKYNGSKIYNYNKDRKIFTVSILVMAQINSAS